MIGAGFAGGAHVEALRRLPGVRVAGIAASTDERAAAGAAALGIERSTGDYRELVTDPAIDVIHNCTPTDMHLEVNLAVLKAGKHLLSEKPLGLDAGETATMVEAARAARGCSGVCFNYRHYPLVAETRERLASAGRRPHLIRGTYLQDWLLDERDWNWRLDPARSGASRALADIGSHWVDLIQHVTGMRLARVCGRVGRLHDVRHRPTTEGATFERGSGDAEATSVATEDFAHVLLEFDGGCSGVLAVSQVSPGMRNRLSFEIDVPDASYGWDQEQPNRLWIGHRDRPSEELVRDAALLAPAAARLVHYPPGHQEGWPDALKNLMADFYAGIRDPRHTPTVATFADADGVTRAIEAILESARSGGWVDVGAAREVAP